MAHLPQVLSQEEVARLIDAAEFSFNRILLMTLYATDAPRAEVAHRKISDIDTRRMVIHIRGGKDQPHVWLNQVKKMRTLAGSISHLPAKGILFVWERCSLQFAAMVHALQGARNRASY